ncbi:WW domain protein [Aspergillus clavatus NRRL 1]|uniref:WW domain protein n=1 Tax=Aspergillus clavatus (strain ATCC 1007 / CBS 513.65 / DSM 816 / NCTC 3887 / NRRL 1 / QM 1276 / 107) TaxID=344612 RepID=A1CE42_ASPCL|nr:WW domain protein [Aspergillus clavatus NRRL 1]EAW11141.1 WW domain protein [Aspergillus clavatus NRRL 1]
MNPSYTRQDNPSEEELFLNTSNRPPTESPVVGPLRFNKRETPSPAPLPYPDDRPRVSHMRSSSSSTGSSPTVEAGRHGSPVSYVNNGPSMPAGSSATRPTEYPAALRPRDGREPKPATLAERRGNSIPKPLPESPGPEAPDRDALFSRMYQRAPAPLGAASNGVQGESHAYADYRQQYWPPPQPSTPSATSTIPRPPTSQGLQPPNSAINRFSSTASNSTTRAQRGSPPPPETPIVGPGQQPGSDIEARYAASGIAGTSTLAGLHAQSAAAQRRAEPYAGKLPRTQLQQPVQLVQPVQRPWTPTEQPGSQPHGPPTVYQGAEAVGAPNPPASPLHPPPPAAAALPPPVQSQQPPRVPLNALEQDLERMRISSSPPPAYSSVSGPVAPQSYPIEKQRLPTSVAPPALAPAHPASMPPTNGAGSVAPPSTTSATPPAVSPQDHPAFANDPRQQSSAGQSPQNSTPVGHLPVSIQNAQAAALAGSSTLPPASPPPLPEGWIAHLDANSGQYYYIHLPTQSTQWEFPKGPTPLNLNETPLSPVGSVYSSHPLASPGLSAFGKPLASPGIPLTPGLAPGYESLQSPVMAVFSGPPPSSGVDLYKTAPTNGVYFGPYLRYTNMDLERGIWLGSILLVTDAAQPPTIHIHQSLDLSPNPRQLKPLNIAVHQRWTFYKYEVDLRMEESGPAKWTYAITSHLGCTRYEFLIAGRYETNWRFVATSGNDFSLNVNANERSRLGGVGFMWKDIMQKHSEIGGFHAQLCLGGQIYADRMWKEIPSLKQWLGISGKEARKNAPWTAAHEEDVSHAYFHYYTSHFDQPYLRESFAQIPYVCQIDDHDIFDGFGSYPEHMQFSNMFKNIGRLGIEMYLLFQHHTTLEILRHVSTDVDLFTITGTGWHFVKFLGPAVVVVGADCRSERNPHQVIAGPTYQGIFPKVAMLPPSVQHCIWMLSVPIIYPRLETAEHIAHTVATGKRAVTGAYNVLGKVTSSVAGVVGAKDMVGSGFDSVKRAVGKSGLMGGILSPFGEFDLLEELRDQWTHESKDLERTYLIRTLQGIAHQKSLRMTFLSGAVNVCGAGLVHDPAHPKDHKSMYQLISSAVVNSPPPSYIIKLLHSSHKPLYVPANGHRSTPSQPTDTKEDMMEIFQTDVGGQAREYRKLMGRRNYIAIVAYDPDAVNPMYGQNMGHAGGKLNLAVDFMVQGEGTYGNVVKYGPVIVPNLEHGK